MSGTTIHQILEAAGASMTAAVMEQLQISNSSPELVKIRSTLGHAITSLDLLIRAVGLYVRQHETLFPINRDDCANKLGATGDQIKLLLENLDHLGAVKKEFGKEDLQDVFVRAGIITRGHQRSVPGKIRVLCEAGLIVKGGGRAQYKLPEKAF